MFNIPSTARSFRDGTPIYCPLRRTWSSINTPFRPGIEPRAVAWQSITLPLRYASSTTYLGLNPLALPVLTHSSFWLWLVIISDEGSLPEITLSGASKLAATYFSLFNRSVHVLYTEIYMCGGTRHNPHPLSLLPIYSVWKGKEPFSIKMH